MENETPEVEGHAEDAIWGASEAELDALLQGGELPESGEDSEPETEDESESAEADSEEEQGEALADDDGEAAEEPAEGPSFATREELQKLQELVTGQGKKLEGQELLLQRRASEIAELKKQYRENIQRAEGQLEELEPAQAAKLAVRIDKANDELAALEQEEAQIGRMAESQEAVKTFVKPQEWDPDAMAVILERQWRDVGQTPPANFREQFKANPHAMASGRELVFLAKQSFAEKIAAQAVAVAKQVIAENEQLKKKSAKPEKVIQGIQRALKKPVPLTGKSTSTGKRVDSLTTKDPFEMSDEELNEVLSKTRR